DLDEQESTMSLKVALDALSKDAKRWDDSADMLKTAATTCAGLKLDHQDFSFMGGSAQKAYEDVRSFMHTYLSDGQRETSGAASALRNVKAAYEGSDQLTKAEIDKIKADWKPE